jgi:hypothetical protein
VNRTSSNFPWTSDASRLKVDESGFSIETEGRCASRLKRLVFTSSDRCHRNFCCCAFTAKNSSIHDGMSSSQRGTFIVKLWGSREHL